MCALLPATESPVWGRVGYNSCRVPFESELLDIRFPGHKRFASNCFGKYYGYLAGSLGFKRAKQDRVGGYQLLRTDHQTNPLCHRKLYYGPGAFAMDIPHGYLAIYANSVLTLADRIHACVVTMAYGGTAMLFSKSPRAQIIERVGATTIFRQPTRLDLSALDRLRKAEIDYLKSVLDE